MKTHNLTQGSPEWHAYRAGHFNASDAPAMLGCSPHKTRTELMHELHTGLTPEVDAATQRRFDDGHLFEALARPLAEEILDEEIYPVVGSLGKLSASFDGLTMCESIAWEHKTLNAELRSVMLPHATGLDLPLMYRTQMEQQLMVSGAKKCLFMASKWDGDTLVEERHCWYDSDPELRENIENGWAQFEIDLANYVPVPVVVAAVGHTPETLPALLIEVTGMVTNSNLEAYKAHALAVIDGINDVLVTDQNFADAEKAIKWCGGVEDDLKGVKRQVIVKAGISGQIDTIDYVMDSTKCKRLNLEKKVVKQKDQLRFEIITHGATELAKHIDALNQRLGKPYLPPVTAVTADFAGAIKGKRTIESMQNAVATTLAQAKIDANATADRISLNLSTIGTYPAFDFLFADVAQLVLKDPNDLHAIVQNRVEQHARQAQVASAEVIAKAQAAIDTSRILHNASGQPTIESEKEAPPVPATTPTLRLGHICERLGFTVTADFLNRLGLYPAATDKNAKLYYESDFELICAALVKHISFVGELQNA